MWCCMYDKVFMRVVLEMSMCSYKHERCGYLKTLFPMQNKMLFARLDGCGHGQNNCIYPTINIQH